MLILSFVVFLSLHALLLLTSLDFRNIGEGRPIMIGIAQLDVILRFGVVFHDSRCMTALGLLQEQM